MKTIFSAFIFAMATVLFLSGNLAQAGQLKPEKKMKPILDMQINQTILHYLDIHELLTSDSTEGLETDAKKLLSAAKTLRSLAIKRNDDKLQTLLVDVIALADKMTVKNIVLGHARKHFKEISEPMITIMENYLPENEKEKYTVYYCNYVEAKWIQKGTKIRNPYYGEDEPECGRLANAKYGDIEGPKNKKHAD